MGKEKKTAKTGYVLAELRLLVGCLGEQSPGWWTSNFFGEPAAAFMMPVFGRSVHQAQYQGVLEAARRVHDERIGVGRTLHLFHMPEQYEQAAASLLADREQGEELVARADSPENALARLEALGSSQQAQEGPMALEDFSDDLYAALAAMAGLYLDAFQRGIQTYPYLREVW